MIMLSKYYITGATGFLGRTVIQKLLEASQEVCALVMSGDTLKDTLPDKAEIRYGDVCDFYSIKRFLMSADKDSCVIHCAGIISVATTPGKRLHEVNVGGTANVVKACRLYNVGKLIYVSSVHALTEKPKGQIIDAKTNIFDPKRVKGAYAKSKATATKIVLDAAKEGLNASVVMPSGIIGPGDAAGGSITTMLRSYTTGKLPIAIRGGYDFVDVRDAADGILSCAEKGKSGESYVLSGHYATIKDILEIAGSYMGEKRKVKYLPIPLAKIISPFYEGDSLRRRIKLLFTPYSVHVLSSNAAFSRENTENELGYSPRPLAETLFDTVKWINKTP